MSEAFIPINVAIFVKLSVLCGKVEDTCFKHNHVYIKGNMISKSHNTAAYYVLISFWQSKYFGLWKTKHCAIYQEHKRQTVYIRKHQGRTYFKPFYSCLVLVSSLLSWDDKYLREQSEIWGCKNSTLSLSFKVISSKIHGINTFCTSEDRHCFLGVDKTAFSISLVLSGAFSRAFFRISVHLSKIYGSDLYEL